MPLRSMTGFGRAERRSPRLCAEAEVRTVNGRYLSVRSRLPGRLARLEPRVEAEVRRHLSRGAVDVFVRVSGETAGAPKVDRQVLGVYQRAARDLGGVDGAALLALPGVIQMEESPRSRAVAERLVLGAMRAALADAQRAREAEGRRLGVVLRRELQAIGRILAAVGRRIPVALRERQRQLRRRLEALLDGSRLPADDPMLRREVAALADRADITEERDRLAGHVQAFREALGAKEPVGRRLDFLLQEMGREANTMGAKSTDGRLTAQVLRLKLALERLREQAANLE